MRLPRVPGYIYELSDGTPDVRPSESAVAVVAAPASDVTACAQRHVRDDRATANTSVRPPHPRDRDALVDLWTRVFTQTPDYCRAPLEYVRTDAEKRIDALFDASSSAEEASRVVTSDETVVGALLAGSFGDVPEVDVIYVDPDHRRRGLGAQLLAAYVSALQENRAEYVVSGYHLANGPSRAWHHRMGFRTLPSLLLVRHVRRSVQLNVTSGHVPARSGQSALDVLERIEQRLSETQEKDFATAAPPLWQRNASKRLDAYFSR
jgi:ribosomal protein S18 acetylase RimI-like enzyme